MSDFPDKIKTALYHGDLAVLRQWLESGYGDLWLRSGSETLLHKAAYNGHVSMIAYLVEKGIPVNVTDNGKYTPLHEAARNGKVEAVKYLLERGADYNARIGDKPNGQLPEEMSNNNNSLEIKKIIEEYRMQPRWIKTGLDEAALVSVKPQIGYKLTEIFNFTNKTYTLVTQNIKTNTECALQRNFSDFEDDHQVQQARQQFTSLGGKLPDDNNYFDKIKPRGGL